MLTRQAQLDAFKTHYIAHRGLYDNATDHPENTLASFARAVEAGFGIELDVRLTKDDVVVVAHDDGLGRICGPDVAIRSLTYAELQQRHVYGSGQTVPAFADVLDLIGGAVPLIVEYKLGDDTSGLCRRTDELLRAYPGPYCIESFDPRVLWWYRQTRPDIIRGQLSTLMVGEDSTGHPVLDRLLTNMVFNPLTRPDFIAYGAQYGGRLAVRFWQALLGATMVAWTIQSPRQLELARARFSVFIFDSFVPGAVGPYQRGALAGQQVAQPV